MWHQCSLHIAFQLGYKLYSVHEQSLKKILADISFITDKFSIDEFHKGFVFKGFTVIHITRSNPEIQELSTFVAYQMKFESEEPSHGAFTSFSYFLKCLMNMDSLVFTYPQRSGVNETETCALPKILYWLTK